MKNFIIYAAIILISFSCSEKSDHKLEHMITWDIQKSGYEFDQYDEMGEIDYDDFVLKFSEFPWIEQLEKINRLQKGSAPTISVKDHENQRALWISILGDRKSYGYLLGHTFPKQEKSFWGLGPEKNIRWVNIYITENEEVLMRNFKLFFSRDYEKLERKLKQLELYDQMKANNY